MKFTLEEQGYIKDVLMYEMKKAYIDDEKTLNCLIDYKTAHIRNLQLRIEAAKRLLKELKK